MNTGKRQKGTRELVEDIFEAHPGWNASQVYERYLALIGDVNKAVTLNAIQKHLEGIKGRYQEIIATGIDTPWHMGTMGPDIDIDAEAVPYILLVTDWAGKTPDRLGNPREHVTIRQAIWLSRLRHTVNLSKVKPKNLHKVAEFLWRWSKAYAQREIGCAIRNIPFETFELDSNLREGGTPDVVGKTIIMWYKDGSFSLDTSDTDLLKQIEHIKKDGGK